MSDPVNRTRNLAKNKAAQDGLRSDAETALDFAGAEHEKNRLALKAIDRFIGSGIDIKDVCCTLE
jgi:hypothetical protein